MSIVHENIPNITIGKFLQELGSSAPAPGGGSTAALSGAMGAALVSMLCNLTLGREKYAQYQDFNAETLKKSDALIHELTECVSKDMTSYDSVIEALKLPKETEQEKAKRSERLQEAYKSATSAPIETAEKCLEVMKLAYSLAGKSNKSAECDLVAAALNANSGIAIAIVNVKVNLISIKDSEYVGKMCYWSDRITREASDILKAIREAVK